MGDAGSHQLGSFCISEIQVGSSYKAELGCDFRSDLVAADADSGTDRGHNLNWVRFVVFLHLVERVNSDARNGPSPARVYRGDRPISGVNQQHWQTIRGSNRDGQTGQIGNQRVAFSYTAFGSCHQNRRRMDLAKGRNPVSRNQR